MSFPTKPAFISPVATPVVGLDSPGGAAAPKVSPVRNPIPAQTLPGVATRISSLQGGSASRTATLPSSFSSAASSAPNSRYPATTPPTGTPRENGVQVVKDWDGMKTAGNENPNHLPFEAMIGVAILAALMHRMSQSASTI
jgi:hypothetical protein